VHAALDKNIGEDTAIVIISVYTENDNGLSFPKPEIGDFH
jgi:hypothetical protein